MKINIQIIIQSQGCQHDPSMLTQGDSLLCKNLHKNMCQTIFLHTHLNSYIYLSYIDVKI